MIKNIFFSKHDLSNKIHKSKKIIVVLIVFLVFGSSTKSVLAQTSPVPTSSSVLYIPLIGISSVPYPLSLPNGSGMVTYNYAVKNFLSGTALNNVKVSDNNCSPVKYVTGDDNGNGMLEPTETWRYSCTTNVSKTTHSIATATGTIGNITASHKAYTTVVVGSNTPPPLVSIVNITKVAYPLSLPPQGGEITFTYRVNNPGVVPLRDVTVTDNKCSSMSGKLGDVNGNNLLDPDEVWIYTCSTILTHTTTNTATVTAYANGFEAIDNVTITVDVASPIAHVYPNPKFPDVGGNPGTGVNPFIKIVVWTVLTIILTLLIFIFLLTRKGKFKKAVEELTTKSS